MLVAISEIATNKPFVLSVCRVFQMPKHWAILKLSNPDNKFHYLLVQTQTLHPITDNSNNNFKNTWLNIKKTHSHTTPTHMHTHPQTHTNKNKHFCLPGLTNPSYGLPSFEGIMAQCGFLHRTSSPLKTHSTDEMK